jgi:predicted kinase
MASATTLVLVTGPPGTGKSTIAEAAAEELSAAVLGWDWAMSALTEFEAINATLAELEVTSFRRVGWNILWRLATLQLRQGRSIVLDGVARDVEVVGSREVAVTEGARFFLVVTSCSDLAVHESRVNQRQRNIPGWYELEWASVVGTLERWEPPTGADLYLDAANALHDNFEAVRSTLL